MYNRRFYDLISTKFTAVFEPATLNLAVSFIRKKTTVFESVVVHYVQSRTVQDSALRPQKLRKCKRSVS